MKVFSNLLIIAFCLTTNIFSRVEFTPHTITTNADDARSVYAVDVDGDGDMDVLSASFGDGKIAWYENDGNEVFTSHTITTNAIFAFSVYAADVDGDDDMDVLSASFGDNKIAWYENLGVVGIEDEQAVVTQSFNLNQNYPNPFNPSTSIQYTVSDNQFVSIKVYDVLGNEVATLVDEVKPTGVYEVEWNATGLPSGVYFYQLKTNGYVETKKMLLLK